MGTPGGSRTKDYRENFNEIVGIAEKGLLMRELG